jgi:hypothetical protein
MNLACPSCIFVKAQRRKAWGEPQMDLSSSEGRPRAYALRLAHTGYSSPRTGLES